MKKLLALILCFALLMTALIVPMSVQAAENLIPTTQITDWDGRFEVAEKGQYLRPKILQNGTVGAAWYVMGEGGKFGISTDGGVTYGNVVQVVSNGWDNTEEERLNGTFNRGRLEVQNPNFIEMENGDLLYTYRYNTYTSEPDSIKSWDKYYTSIRYQISTDGGKNWSEPAIIAEKEFDDPDNEEGHAGYWEPEPIYINGELYVYWCDTVTGKPDFSFQHVRGAKWNGTGFDASFIAVNGQTNQSREGMCVITELSDGSYAMIIESTDTDDNTATHNDCGSFLCSNDDEDGLTFVIKIARSKDGVNWTKPVTVAKPDKLVSEDMADKNGALAVCASPYIITLPDGRLAISYQTSDLYKGDVIPQQVTRRSVVQVAVSDIAIGYDTAISTANFNKIAESPADLGDNQFANAGSLLYNNGRIFAYTYTGTNILNEDGSVTSKSEGLKGAYINLETEKNYNDIDGYLAYNNKSSNVTVNNGAFVMPGDNGATKLIAGKKIAKTKEYLEAVPYLYNAAKWNTIADKFTFNADSIDIKTGATKAYVLGTEEMKDFTASATFKGNSLGYIYAGFNFHVQTKDFSLANFNTSGYMVFVKRNSETGLNSAEIHLRYCEGKDKKDEVITLNVTGLGTAIDLKLRLDITVKDGMISTSLYDDKGNLLGEGTEYPLERATVNYESGAFGLISNGVHTVTDFTLAEIVTEGEVKGVYDSANWQTKANKFTFNSDSIKIAGGATKAYMLNTDGMEDLSASLTIQGNTIVGDDNEGSIYAGVALHLQPEDFPTAAFNTSGYSVFIKRDKLTGNPDKASVIVRYCVNGTEAGAKTVLTVTGLGTANDVTLKLNVTVKDGKILTSLYDSKGNLLGEGEECPLDYTAIDTDTKYYESGSFGIISNGAHTITNLSVSRIKKEIVVDEITPIKADTFAGSAEFKLTENLTGANQAGFALRVKDATNKAPGLTGYVLYIYYATNYTAGQVKYQLIRYGTKADGTLNQNLGVIDTVDLKEGFLGDATVGKTLILSFELKDNILTVNAEGKESGNKAATKTFDLTTKSTSSSVEYTDYYADGGYGFYKFGPNAIEISNIEFGAVKQNIDNLDGDLFTVYSPEGSKGVEIAENKITSLDSAGYKLMIKDKKVSDFSADATFQIGEDGKLNNGIIFRAQNLGNEKDTMEGYSVVVWKNAHTTGNNGRIVMLLYKWGRDADGKLVYLGEIARLVDTSTFNSVYPDAQTDILAAVGAYIKLNVEVEGTKVTAKFDVFNEENIIAASSKTATFDLTTPIEDSKEGIDTLYNYGDMGVSMSSKSSLCSFNVDGDEYTNQILNAENFTEYTSNTNKFTTITNDEIYSKLGGVKRLVDWTQSIEDFKITSRFKAFSETAQAFGFDFGLNPDEFNVVSGGSTVVTSTAATQYNSGYRITFSRKAKDSSDLVIYFSTYSSDGNGGYTSSNPSKTFTNFFAEYYADKGIYKGAEMDVEVLLDKNGNLTASASLVGYSATATYTVTGVDAEGCYGIYMNNGGTLTGTKVALSSADDVITTADCENGFVYAAQNSGAAKDGDTVVIVPKANEGFAVDTVSYTVNGKTTSVEAVDGVYSFAKPFGATEISATFKEAAVIGDINGDGKVDGTDLVWLSKILLKVETEYDAVAADITGNGVVDVRDLVALKELAKNA